MLTPKARVVLLLVVVAAFSGCGKSKAEREAELAKVQAAAEKVKADAEAKESARLAEEKMRVLQQEVVSIMKDPASTQFRAVRMAADNETLCGEVNSKNSFGGYVGFRPFMVYRGEVLIASPTERATFEQGLMTLKYLTNLEQSGCAVE